MVSMTIVGPYLLLDGTKPFENARTSTEDFDVEDARGVYCEYVKKEERGEEADTLPCVVNTELQADERARVKLFIWMNYTVLPDSPTNRTPCVKANYPWTASPRVL